MPDSTEEPKTKKRTHPNPDYWRGINVSRDLPLEKSPLRIYATKFPGAPDKPTTDDREREHEHEHEREQDRLKDALASLDVQDPEDAEHRDRLTKILEMLRKGEPVPPDLSVGFLDE